MDFATFPFKPNNKVLYTISGLYSYIKSQISIVIFLVFGFPFTYPFSIADLASSSLHYLPF